MLVFAIANIWGFLCEFNSLWEITLINFLDRFNSLTAYLCESIQIILTIGGGYFWLIVVFLRRASREICASMDSLVLSVRRLHSVTFFVIDPHLLLDAWGRSKTGDMLIIGIVVVDGGSICTVGFGGWWGIATTTIIEWGGLEISVINTHSIVFVGWWGSWNVATSWWLIAFGRWNVKEGAQDLFDIIFISLFINYSTDFIRHFVYERNGLFDDFIDGLPVFFRAFCWGIFIGESLCHFCSDSFKFWTESISSWGGSCDKVSEFR